MLTNHVDHDPHHVTNINMYGKHILLPFPSSPPLYCQVWLMETALGDLRAPMGGPLTFAEPPRPFMVLSGTDAPLVAAAAAVAGGGDGSDSGSEDSGVSVTGGVNSGDHLMKQVWGGL